MPDPKDAVIGIFGASRALPRLLLVFGGLIFAQAASFPASTDDKIVERYARAGRLAILPFWGFLATTLMSVFWLVFPNHCTSNSPASAPEAPKMPITASFGSGMR